MHDTSCRRCGKALTQVQRWNRKKYCCRDCFYDTRFGERIEWNGVWIRPGQTRDRSGCIEVKLCKRCGQPLTFKQVKRGGQYCGRSCFFDTLFGEAVEWNGIKIRPGHALEVLKLCHGGMTESAARQAVGAHDSAIKLLKSSPELAKLLPKRVCLICGDSLLHQHLGRKYCSSRCQSKADYDRRRVAAGHPKPKRQGDHAKRDQAVELYVHGLNCSSIAQHLGIPKKQAKNWIYYHGAKKLAEISGDVTLQRPLRHRLNEATNVEAWASILHEAAESSDDSESVVLVCGTIHGSGAVGRYADIVLEKLKQNLVDGTRFAFCNVLYNAITTIEWCGETFHLTRSLKLSGTFAWPSEELGDFVMVSEKAFLYLIAYQKTTRRNKYIIENP